MIRIGKEWWHRHFTEDYVIYFIYLSPGDITALVLNAPDGIREFAEEAIEDIKHRALRG